MIMDIELNNFKQMNLTNYLERNIYAQQIKQFLNDFELNKNNILQKRGIYIYGESGSGKTTFIKNILKEMNYDVITYDAGDIRNKSIIESITKHNMSDKNIMSLFHKQVKKIVILMDEIDGMNNGDKGGINTLIKIMRPKKTKKQKTEEITLNPIICIGNYHIDKKIKELMKVCMTIELPKPTNRQIKTIIETFLRGNENLNQKLIKEGLNYIEGDLRKLQLFFDLCKLNETNLFNNILLLKTYNQDPKIIVKQLYNNNVKLEQHMSYIDETDRTIIGLLWHENITDIIKDFPKKQAIQFYINVLNNICFADHIDRITFQKQIWQFNEMSSLIKTFQNNMILHNTFPQKKYFNPKEVRFTKVLTKYSTEYNNSLFIKNLCYELSMDKKDLITYFTNIRNLSNKNEISNLLDNYELSQLDINRMYRYLDKYIKDNVIEDEMEIE
jgi:DNA polymerase III delta prime subunit